MPLPARNIEGEQDRAPPVQLHLDELARPALIDIRTIVELNSATTTETGLTVQAAYDPECNATGVKISDEQIAAIPITPHGWHGEWTDTIAAA